MDSSHIATINKTPITFTRNVYFNAPSASDTITEGMALCWDTTASAANRNVYVTKPTLNNSTEFCGVVAPGARLTGSGWVEVLICEGVLARGVNVYTDESVVTGDLLGIIPGEYALGKVVVGRAVARAIETQDRSATAGLVATHFGNIESVMSHADVASKVNRFFDHFIGEGAASATADASRYAATLNSGTIVFADNLTNADVSGGTAAKSGWGTLAITPAAAATETSMQLNGEPFSMAVGKSLFFRARVAMSSIASTVQGFIGLVPTDTSPIASLNADYIGFITATGAVNHVYVKDGTTGLVTKSTGTTLVADTFVELAFLVRLKTASTVDLHIWVDGTEVSSPTETATEIVDNESLTFTASAIDSGSGQPVLRIDRVEINNYIG